MIILLLCANPSHGNFVAYLPTAPLTRAAAVRQACPRAAARVRGALGG